MNNFSIQTKLVDFSAGKTQPVLFDWSNNGSIDVKMDGSVLKEK